ncbi:MAG: glycosyltransferase [Candidatus Microgenomates bacterium]|jgi:dolichol-phosphate mannosyltransferase
MDTLTVVIPVRNEAESLPKVVFSLKEKLSALDYRILIIDDGYDYTEEALDRSHLLDTNVQYINRPPEKRNGLAGAIIDGVAFAIPNSEFVMVMDGDGQHPPEVTVRMLRRAQTKNADMVFASRYIKGGSASGLEGGLRKIYSSLLRQLPRVIFPKIRKATDPLAGCFLIRSKAVRLENVRAIGWKAGLEFLLFSSIERYEEVGYEFHSRIGGESKANATVGLRYFQQLASLAFRYYLPNWRKECADSPLLKF